jgi:hypothetical protein
MGKHITDFERALIRELALSGLFSAYWIAKMLGRNKGTILKFVKDIRHSPNIRFPQPHAAHPEDARGRGPQHRDFAPPQHIAHSGHAGAQAARDEEKPHAPAAAQTPEGESTMDNDSLNENGGAVILAMVAAVSGFIVGVIAFGSIWVLTH